MQKYQTWKKKFTSSDYNELTNNTLDAKITKKKLINKFDLDKKVKEEIKIVATELKTEQDKIVNLQTYDVSFFIGQSYFINDGSHNYLVFQAIYKTIITFSRLPLI